MVSQRSGIGLSILFLFWASFAWSSPGFTGPNFVAIAASTPQERTALNAMGVSIDEVLSDTVYATVNDAVLAKLLHSSFTLRTYFKIDTSKVHTDGFPPGDEPFHDYSQVEQEMNAVAAARPDLVKVFSIGKTVQGREILCARINTASNVLDSDNPAEQSGKPGVLFIGNHHAREHLSAEVPLLLLHYLVDNYDKDSKLKQTLDRRDIFIIPMLNPDGVQYDIEKNPGHYQMQRKNMSDPHGIGERGVDLNRNYGFQWEGEGSSSDVTDETYRGPAPFSEPETQAVRNFIASMPNIKIMLSYHTYSELILYPWGYTYDPLCGDGCSDQKLRQDQLAFVAMGRQMARWNKYTAEQSSALYIVNGEAVDWAYATYGILGFTFEMSPRDSWGGNGFYPGAGMIPKVFNDNLNPALYLIDMADNPYRSIQAEWPNGQVDEGDLNTPYSPSDAQENWFYRIGRLGGK